MVCWERADRPRDKQVMHIKIVLKKERNETGAVCKYEGRLVVWANEEVGYQEEIFSPVPN